MESPKEETVEIRFDLYKESGKWKYGGLSKIPASVKLWDYNFIKCVAKGQTCVVEGAFSNGEYYLVTSDQEKYDKDSNYTHFYGALFTPAEVRDAMK